MKFPYALYTVDPRIIRISFPVGGIPGTFLPILRGSGFI